MTLSAEHFNFKHYSIEGGGGRYLEKYDFQQKLYENGEQNIQFYIGFHFFALRSKHLW